MIKDAFFEGLSQIIESLGQNERFTVPELIVLAEKQSLTSVSGEWNKRDHASAGREFYNLVIAGEYDKEQYSVLVQTERKNPQVYKKSL